MERSNVLKAYPVLPVCESDVPSTSVSMLVKPQVILNASTYVTRQQEERRVLVLMRLIDTGEQGGVSACS